jgi:hypothetical protein
MLPKRACSGPVGKMPRLMSRALPYLMLGASLAHPEAYS